MNTIVKGLLLVFTLVPGAHLLIIMTGVVPLRYETLGTLHVAVMALSGVLAVTYLYLVIRNPLVEGERRYLWAFFVVLAGFVGRTIYYAKYVASNTGASRYRH